MSGSGKTQKPKNAKIKKGILSQAATGDLAGLVITKKGVIYMKK